MDGFAGAVVSQLAESPSSSRQACRGWDVCYAMFAITSSPSTTSLTWCSRAA
jgi:hypothetical protein